MSYSSTRNLGPYVGRATPFPHKRLTFLVSLWQKYNSLPRNGRLYIGFTTMAVAYFGGKLVDNMYDEQLLKEEAERRLELAAQQQRKAEDGFVSDK